jgi:hypothetical protein
MTHRLAVSVAILAVLLASACLETAGRLVGPTNSATGDGMVGDGSPDDTLPGDGAPGDTRLGDARPGDARPEDGTPDTAVPQEKFSFFVTSLAALQQLSGSQDGFGGDLRFG